MGNGMSIKRARWPYVQSDGTIVEEYIADTEAERPSGLPPGSRCFTKDTNKEWVVNAAGSWQELGGGGVGGEHPDLATHVALGLDEEHTHPYSSDIHNHDAAYSALGHSHGGGGGEAFPVGSVFIAVVSTNPATLLGYGSWTQIAGGRVLVGQTSGDTDFDTAEETGGTETHTHVSHATGSARSGGGATSLADASHDIAEHMPPYFVTYFWRRDS
jgi:hypothetical protein